MSKICSEAELRFQNIEKRVSSLEVSVAKIDVKLNVITFLGASSVIGVISLIVALVSQHL
jgi:hypothetical protein